MYYFNIKKKKKTVDNLYLEVNKCTEYLDNLLIYFIKFLKKTFQNKCTHTHTHTFRKVFYLESYRRSEMFL